MVTFSIFCSFFRKTNKNILKSTALSMIKDSIISRISWSTGKQNTNKECLVVWPKSKCLTASCMIKRYFQCYSEHSCCPCCIPSLSTPSSHASGSWWPSSWPNFARITPKATWRSIDSQWGCSSSCYWGRTSQSITNRGELTSQKCLLEDALGLRCWWFDAGYDVIVYKLWLDTKKAKGKW